MPPDSANAIASLIWRRSKYFSRVTTDRTVSAQGAGPLGVLRPEAKVVGGDAARRLDDPALDQLVIGLDGVLLAAAHVEQDQLWISAPGQHSTPCREAVDPQLQRIRLHQRGVQRGVGLEVDQGDVAVDLADAVDEATHARVADRDVEPRLDGERPRAG